MDAAGCISVLLVLELDVAEAFLPPAVLPPRGHLYRGLENKYIGKLNKYFWEKN